MIKKIFIVSVVVFVVALSAFVVQKVFFDGSKEVPQSETSRIEQREEQAKEEVREKVTNENAKRAEKLIRLVDSGVKGATIAGNSSQVLYYHNQRFLSVDFNGTSRNSVGAYPFVNVKSIEWDSNKKRALVKDGNSFYVYDLNRSDIKQLSENVDTVIWEYQGERVLYKHYDAERGQRIIGLMNPYDEANKKDIITDIPYKLLDFAPIPKINQSCYFPASSTNGKELLRCYDWEKNEMTLEFDGGFGADYLWSDDGSSFLVSYLQEQGGNRLLLGSANEKGSEFKGLNFSTTVKKCTWAKDNKHAYCAIMGGVPDLATLPDDWNDKEFNSVDTFWKINTSNGKKERLIDVEKISTEIDAINLFVDKNESYLFFIDRKTGALYRLAL